MWRSRSFPPTTRLTRTGVRFEQEARATAALNHAHIVVVYDVGTRTDAARLAVVRSGPPYQLEFPLGHLLAKVSEGWFSSPRISPDEQQVAFFEHPTGDDRGVLCLVDLNGHKRVLSTGWSSPEGLAWSPSGREVWFAGSDTGSLRALYAVSLSGRQRTSHSFFVGNGGLPVNVYCFDFLTTSRQFIRQLRPADATGV